jgi:hypothetical protein
MAAGTNDAQLLAALTKGCGQKTRSRMRFSQRSLKVCSVLLNYSTSWRDLKAAVQRQLNRCCETKGGGATPTLNCY